MLERTSRSRSRAPLQLVGCQELPSRRGSFPIQHESRRAAIRVLVLAVMAREYIKCTRVDPSIGSVGSGQYWRTPERWSPRHPVRALIQPLFNRRPPVAARPVTRRWRKQKICATDPADPLALFNRLLNEWPNTTQHGCAAHPRAERCINGAQRATRSTSRAANRPAPESRTAHPWQMPGSAGLP